MSPMVFATKKHEDSLDPNSSVILYLILFIVHPV